MKDIFIEGGYYAKARCIQFSEIAHASPHIREIWDYLLREANHKDVKHHGMIISRGQCFRRYEDILESLHWMVGYRKGRYSVHQCETAMKWLKKRGMITTKKTTRGMIITICNYDYYQTPENYENHTRTRTKTTVKPQSSHTINKKGKNDNKEYLSSFHEQFWVTYPRKVGKQDSIKAWLQLFLVNGKNPSEYYAGELTKEILNEITTALKLQNEHTFSKKDKKYIPYPASWLRGHRWEDALDDNLKEKDWVNNYD